MKNCTICNLEFEAINPRKKFCSPKCRNRDTNRRHQNYECQQSRGEKRKIELITIRGGKCENCGYCKNYSALQFHHTNPSDKDHQLDLRSLSNRSMEAIMEEFSKCILLCANCHAEHHHPDCH